MFKRVKISMLLSIIVKRMGRSQLSREQHTLDRGTDVKMGVEKECGNFEEINQYQSGTRV